MSHWILPWLGLVIKSKAFHKPARSVDRDDAPVTRHRRSAGGWTPTGPAVPEPPAEGQPGRERGEGLSEHGATAGPRGGPPHRQLDMAGEARGLPAAGLGRRAGGGQGTRLGLLAQPPRHWPHWDKSQLTGAREAVTGRCRVSAEALSP